MNPSRLNIPVRKILCCEDTPGGPCALRPHHAGSHLPMPERGGVAVNVPPDPDDARPAPEDRCVHCAGWGFFEDVDGEGLDGDLPCGHCGGTGLEPS